MTNTQLHHIFTPGVVTSSTASLLQSVVLAWSERTKIKYVCSGNKNCCYALNLVTEYWYHADFWVINHRTYWYMFLNKWKSSVVYTLPSITKLVKWSRSFTAQSMFQEGTIFLELWKWSILCCLEPKLQLLLENIMNHLQLVCPPSECYCE